jgi:uncharacterized membrane protein YhaH (DUF805 family)
MVNEYLDIWRSFFNYKESLSRKKFWLFNALNYIGFSILIIICIISSENWFELFFENQIDRADFIDLFQFGIHLIFQLLSLVLFSTGIRRINDINKSPGYIFVPLYNFYLCLLPKFDEDAVANPNHSLKASTFLKIVLFSFLIGVICFLTIAHIDFGGGYGALFVYAIVICVFVNTIIITMFILLIYVFKKNKIETIHLTFYFIIVGVLAVIITNVLAYYVT